MDASSDSSAGVLDQSVFSGFTSDMLSILAKGATFQDIKKNREQYKLFKSFYGSSTNLEKGLSRLHRQGGDVVVTGDSSSEKRVVACIETWPFLVGYAALTTYVGGEHKVNGGLDSNAVIKTLQQHFFAGTTYREAIKLTAVDALIRRNGPGGTQALADKGSSNGSSAATSAAAGTSGGKLCFSLPVTLQLVAHGLEQVRSAVVGDAFYSLRAFVYNIAPFQLGWVHLSPLGEPRLRELITTRIVRAAAAASGSQTAEYVALLLPKHDLSTVLHAIAHVRKEEVGIGVKGSSGQAVYRKADGVLVATLACHYAATLAAGGSSAAVTSAASSGEYHEVDLHAHQLFVTEIGQYVL